MKHHRLFAVALVLSWILAAGGGLLFAHYERLSPAIGLYWAIGTVTTSGGDFSPHTGGGYWADGLTKLLAIPVWAFSFALASSWLTSLHVGRAAEDVKAHVTEQVSNAAP